MFIFCLILTILFIPVLIGLTALLTTKRDFPYSRMPALLFHSVNKNKDNGLSHIHPKLFEKYLKKLKENHISTVTVSEAFSDNRVSHKVALVFDDGFEDFYNEVFPLLKKYKCKATLFPVTKSIDNNFSWDIYSNKPNISAVQLKEISDYGIEIGSHSHSHPDLTRTRDTNLKKELEQSKEILEKITEKKITSLSFPFGSWNRRIWRVAKTTGYLNACAYRGFNHAEKGIMNVVGVYSFDTLDSLLQKSKLKIPSALTVLRSRIMPHFAKGTALWNYRREYLLLAR